MEKILTYIKSGNEFFLKYWMQYIKLIAMPMCVGIFGIVSVFVFISLLTVSGSLLFAFLPLCVSLPCIFYSFWRCYLITYSLNIASFKFSKKIDNFTIKDCYAEVQKDGRELGKYVSFFAIITIICYIPTIILSDISNFSIENLSSNIQKIMLVSCVNTLFIAPLINFHSQAFYFRKENENYIDVMLNCFKRLDLNGIIISIGIVFLANFISSSIFAFLILFLNIYFYAINTFWYLERQK